MIVIAPLKYFCFEIICQVMNKMVYIMSLMGNNGTFNKPMRTKLQDKETMYHIFYLVICLSGMCIHPFFYSLLVSIFMSVEC